MLAVLVASMLGWSPSVCAQSVDHPDSEPENPRTVRLQLVDPMRVKGLLQRTDDGPDGFLKELTEFAFMIEGIGVDWVAEEPYTFNHGLEPDSGIDGIVALSITESKTSVFEFTSPMFITSGVAVVRAGVPAPASVREMQSKRVIVVKNGAGHQWCLENSVQFEVFDTVQQALVAVQEGRADVCVTTQMFWRAHAKLYDIKGLEDRVVTDPPFHRAFAIAMTPTSRRLANAFNVGLAKLRDSGQYDRIYQKWLGNVLPQTNVSQRAGTRPTLVIATTSVLCLGVASLAFVFVRRRWRRAEILSQGLIERELAECVSALAYAYYTGDQGERKLLWCNSKLTEWNRLFPFLKPGTHYGDGFQASIHPDDVHAYEQATARSREDRTRFHAEFRLLASDGRYRSLISICLPSHVEGGTIWHGLLVDRTEMVEAAKLASSAERNYRAVFDRCHDAILIADAQSGRVLDCNKRAAELYRISKSRLVGSTLETFIPEISELFASDGQAEFRQNHRCSDGQVIVAEVSVSRIAFAGRDATLIMIRNATERVKAEELERVQREYIERSNRLEGLGRTAGGAAHAFNNYLTAIVGNVELARFEAPPGWSGFAALDRAAESAGRAASLARQMLLCAGRGGRANSLVALDRLVEDTWPLLRAAVSTRITLGPPNLASTPPVRADAEELRLAILNIILNAAEALEDTGGRISVATGVALLSTERLTAALAESPRPGPHAYVEVSDNGVGIPPELLPRIFEPFYTSRGPGRGLGLAVTVGIARRFGGCVEIINRFGQAQPGVTARLYLPLAKPGSYLEPTPENRNASLPGESGGPTSK